MSMQVYIIIMKTKYDTKVEYIEDNQNVCIRLVMTLDMECSSMIVAMATVLPPYFCLTCML